MSTKTHFTMETGGNCLHKLQIKVVPSNGSSIYFAVSYDV